MMQMYYVKLQRRGDGEIVMWMVFVVVAVVVVVVVVVNE